MLKERKLKKQVRNKWLRKLMRAHIFITVLFLGVYFSVAFFDPGFLSYDLRQKYHALADELVVITATVLGPPVHPIVTGVSRCNQSNILRNFLDWEDDRNTYTYDINRDGLPLVTGLTVSAYSDTNITPSTTYHYTVTAYGPMGSGFAVSNPVTVTTASGCTIMAKVPAANIASSGQGTALSNDAPPSIIDLQPLFSGTSTIPYAIVHIQVESPMVFIATVTANANGYWSWRPPAVLSVETHTLTVEAVDPEDSTITELSTFVFSVVTNTSDSSGSSGSNSSDPSGSSESNSKSTHIKQAVSVPANTSSPAALFDFSLSIKNNNQAVTQGQDMQVVLNIIDIPKQYNETTAPIRYTLIDEKGRTIFSTTRDTFLKKGKEILETFLIPRYTSSGKYSLQAEILPDRMNVSRMVGLSIEEAPLFDLGSSGTVITYAQVARNLGWVVIVLLISLLLWLFMFIREYGMYLQAIRHITEQHLRKAGFITKRKGVIR
ncbi:MAG: hypothetical protein NTY33_02810 [Candidatus Moranbacteria bacterium]|nr:hypothetical protein [Candidatus Moranbacteria bacterium]